MADDLAFHHRNEGYVGIHSRAQRIYEGRFFGAAKRRFMHLKYEFGVFRSFRSNLDHTILSKRLQRSSGVRLIHGGNRAPDDEVAIGYHLDLEVAQRGLPELVADFRRAVGCQQRVVEVRAEDFGLAKGIAIDQLARATPAFRTDEVHDEDERRRPGPPARARPQHLWVSKVVKQGIGEDEVVGSARRRVSRQRGLVEADSSFEARAFCRSASQLEHRGRAIQGIDAPLRKGPNEPKRDVSGAAPEIQGDAIGRKIDQALLQEIDESAVWLFEIGRGVSSGLVRVEHQLRLCDAIHFRCLPPDGSTLTGSAMG
jgi:hypothetical protein